MNAAWRKRVLVIGGAVSFTSAICVIAQAGGGTPPPRGVPGEDGIQGGQGHRPRPPLELALDANGDGVIDAGEIANAATALKKLDKNGDGKLTADEYRPPRPPRMEGEGPGGEAPGRR